MFENISYPIGEGSIAIVDIQQIIAEVIIGNINIWISVVIEVVDQSGMTVSTPNDSGIERNIFEYSMAF
jgi:hypothetical protein